MLRAPAGQSKAKPAAPAQASKPVEQAKGEPSVVPEYDFETFHEAPEGLGCKDLEVDGENVDDQIFQAIRARIAVDENPSKELIAGFCKTQAAGCEASCRRSRAKGRERGLEAMAVLPIAERIPNFSLSELPFLDHRTAPACTQFLELPEHLQGNAVEQKNAQAKYQCCIAGYKKGSAERKEIFESLRTKRATNCGDDFDAGFNFGKVACLPASAGQSKCDILPGRVCHKDCFVDGMNRGMQDVCLKDRIALWKAIRSGGELPPGFSGVAPSNPRDSAALADRYMAGPTNMGLAEGCYKEHRGGHRGPAGAGF